MIVWTLFDKGAKSQFSKIQPLTDGRGGPDVGGVGGGKY